MSAKALRYAEENLGVHKVWQDAQASLTKLDELLADLDKAQDDKRRLNENYADREVELILHMRGIHPSMSDTRFKSQLKEWERSDEALSQIRTELNMMQGQVQGLEYDVDLCRLRIKANCSRMYQLGGYLQYLAVVKTQAEQTTKTTQKEVSE